MVCRSLIPAEGYAVGALTKKEEELQWGRSLIPAEGGKSHDNMRQRQGSPASMGPQFNPCGRLRWPHTRTAMTGLQWGRSLIPAEGGMPGNEMMAEEQLQWGRSLIPAEGASGIDIPFAYVKLQWGRSLIPAEG